jgi:uncharacterized BrkB/YihY/UPF0761 family membrane protein
MRWRVYFAVIRQAGRAWIDDGAPSMGAALAFYSAFSIAPLLIIVIGIAGAVYGVDVARGVVQAQLTDLMGPTAAGAHRRRRPGRAGTACAAAPARRSPSNVCTNTTPNI